MAVIRWKNLCKVVGLCLLLSTGTMMAVQGESPFLPVKDIKTGMTGIAKTVVKGDEISTFQVKVLGVMKDKGPSGDLILAEFSGSVIDKSGGIAHGMSGSPVYIDGKLVGAVAYGWGFQRSHLGMITPIEQMVKLWHKPNTGDLPNPWMGDKQLIPLGTPLMATGFDKDALKFLQDKLKAYDVKAYDTADSSADTMARPLEPGSSVAATLIDGDLKLGAIGTVTYVDGNRIVAFGHPYLKEGNTGYFMHNSSIFTVVNSVESSFKLGSIGPRIGAITEDRGAGIAGTVGELPKFVPVTINVLDKNLGRVKEARVIVVDEPSLAPSLVTTSVYNFLTKTIDRRGGGTGTISYSIVPKNSALPTYKRSDMFYSKSNVALKTIDDLYNIYSRLVQNSFVDYEVSHVNVDVTVSDERRTAEIIDATAAPVIVSPGDAVYLNVKLHPYRGEDFTRKMVFLVPENQPLGEMILEVRGGGVIPLPVLVKRQQLNLTDTVIQRFNRVKSFKELFKRLEGYNTNNQIVVEILNEEEKNEANKEDKEKLHAKLTGIKLDPNPDKDYKKIDDSDDLDKRMPSKDVSILTTDYVILGDGQLPITVVGPNEKEKALRNLVKKRIKEAAESAKKKAYQEKNKSIREKVNDAKKEAGQKLDRAKYKANGDKDDNDKVNREKTNKDKANGDKADRE